MTEETAKAEQPAKGQFAIQRVYVRDMSFESPLALNERSQSKPKINQEINTKVNSVGNDLFEVVLQLTVTVKLSDEEDAKTAFLAEVHQAGLFLLKDIPEEHRARLLFASCPNILFPYARETVDSMATKGGFPAVSLPPLNFDQLYLESVARQKAQQEANQASPEQIN